MTEKPKRQRPQEQDPNVRRHNFDAVESNLTAEQVKAEVARCLHCKNARCVTGCPVNINIPDFIAALKEDKLEKAGDIIRETSFLPSVVFARKKDNAKANVFWESKANRLQSVH